jgi:hypothetical protein
MKAEAVAMTCRQARELLETGVHALVFWRPNEVLNLRDADSDLAIVTIYDKGE